MGNMFTFIRNQYRLEVDGHKFFIHILIYYRQLQCLMAIELKSVKFQPEYIEKIQFYLYEHLIKISKLKN